MINKDAFEILPVWLFEDYLTQVDPGAFEKFNELHDSELSISTFSFYTSISAVFSSKIEGESIELDSFIKHKRFGASFLPDYTQKIDDLYEAYVYAQQTPLSLKAVNKAHSLITAHILAKGQRGEIRKGNMFVVTTDGRIEYVAAALEKVEPETAKLFRDIDGLLLQDLTFFEALYFASLIHLVFVKIHPYEDGNGRTARLIEKWFLAEKLGVKAWFMEPERYYYEHHNLYYKNIRLLGLEYDMLNYSKSLQFLLMLPNSLTAKNNDE